MAGKSSGQGNKSGSSSKTGAGKVVMSPVRASAIQSHAMKTAGTVKAGSFLARAQSAAAHNVNAGIVSAVQACKP